MIVATCPNCQARYQLTARQLGPAGRTLKCARCGNQWFQPPSVPVVTPPEQPAPAPDDLKVPATVTPAQEEHSAAVPLAPEVPESKTDLSAFATLGTRPRWHRRVTATPLGVFIGVVLGLTALIGVGIWSLLQEEPSAPENTVATPLPADTITPPNLVLSDVQRTLARRGDTWVLTISGRLTNTGKEAMPLPELRVQLLDRSGVELDFWPAELTTTNLKAGEETTWQARFLNPSLTRLGGYRAFFRNAPATLPEVVAESHTNSGPALDDTPTTHAPAAHTSAPADGR